MRKDKQIIASLKHQHGVGFVAKLMFERDTPTIGDEWGSWGATDVVRAIYRYMKELFTSFTTYAGKLSWQNIMNNSDADNFPLFDVLELISQLGETVSGAAKTIACKFIEKIGQLFEYLRKVMSGTEDQEVEALESELTNCASYLNKLGEKGIEFIQWVANKMKAAVNLMFEAVLNVFKWLGDVVVSVYSSTYDHSLKALQGVGKGALRVGIFSVSMVAEMASWSVLHTAEIAKRTGVIAKNMIQHLVNFFNAIGALLLNNTMVSATLTKLLEAAGVLQPYIGSESAIRKAITKFGGYVAVTAAMMKKAFSFLGVLNRLPNIAFQRVFGPFANRMFAPIADYFGRKMKGLFEESDPMTELDDTLAVAQDVYDKVSAPTFLREVIAEATEVRTKFMEKDKERKAAIPFGERIEISWTLSEGMIFLLEGKALTAKQDHAINRALGPGVGMAIELQAIRAKLFTAITAAGLKSEAEQYGNATTTQEEDAEFLKLWEKTTKRNEPIGNLEDDPHFWLELKKDLRLDREAVLGACVRMDARKDTIDGLTRDYAKALDQIERDEKKAIYDREAIDRSYAKVKKVALILGIISVVAMVLNTLYTAYTDREKIIKLELEYTNTKMQYAPELEVVRKLTSMKDFQDKNVVLTYAAYEDGLTEKMSHVIKDLPPKQVSELFFSLKDQLNNMGGEVADAAKKNAIALTEAGVLDMAYIDAEGQITKSWAIGAWWRGETWREALNDEKTVKSFVIEEMRSNIQMAVSKNMSAIPTGFNAFYKKQTGDTPLGFIFSMAMSWVAPDLMNPVSTLINALVMGNTAFLSGAFFAITTSILLPIAIIGVVFVLLSIAADAASGFTKEKVINRGQENVANVGTLVFGLHAFFGSLYDLLAEDAAKVKEERKVYWAELTAGLTEWGPALANILSLFNWSTYFTSITTFASFAGRKVVRLLTAKEETNSRYEARREQLKFPYKEFLEKDRKIREEAEKHREEKGEQVARSACQYCPKLATLLCGDCRETPYCSQECGDFDLPFHSTICVD